MYRNPSPTAEMILKKRLETILLSQIGPVRDSPFCFRYVLPGRETAEGPGRDLIDSITSRGIINPPILAPAPGEGAGKIIVTGHRRIAAAAAAGITSFEGLVAEAPRLELLHLWLEDAASGPPLSELDKLLLSARARNLAGEDLPLMLPALSRIFGREMTLEIAGRLARLLDLGAGTRKALHDCAVSTGDLLLLDAHPAISAPRAVEMLAAERMSRGLRKETVRLMLFLADQGRDKWDSFELLRRSPCAGAAKPLREALQRACRPTLEKDLSEIGGIVAGMGLPTEASIRIPGNLEGDSVRLEIRIRDEKRLGDALEKVRRSLDEGRMGRILDILKGK